MSDRDERIERLISRKLDGELTPDERLELDRALIRSPEHRAMLERSSRIEAWCGDVIGEELRVERCAVGSAGGEPLAIRRRGGARWWWLVPGALAACLSWFVFDVAMERGAVTEPLIFTGGDPSATRDVREGRSAQPVRPVSMHRGMTEGRRETGVYGIVGSDGNVYLIELDRLRAVRRPAAQHKTRVPLGEL